MKIKNRLIAAFFIIITLPIILICSATGTIMYYTVNAINQYYNVNATTYDVLTNPIFFVNFSINKLYKEINLEIENDPDLLLGKNRVEEWNELLLSKSSFLIISKNERPIYIGNQDRYQEIRNLIPKTTIYYTQEDSGLYIDDKPPFLCRKTDFKFSNGDKGELVIITDVKTLLPQVKKSAIDLLLCILAIICFTAIFLTIWIYQGMVRPLNILREGIYRMKNGDLDFQLQTDSGDEIGQICDDFEDMRQQVKKLMEERLEYEEQMKDLISNISHDLKTPLTAIKGYSEGILDGVASSPDKMDRYIRTIYTKASDMTYLVDELSFYSKIDCNKVPYNMIKVNLEQYFSDCIGDLTLDLEVKNITLKYLNTARENIMLMIDPEQIKRVINNIISNSVKYMDKPNGEICVFISENDGEIQLEFADNGAGIEERELEKIFERFYRTDKSRNSARGGSGLGLAIAKKIVEDHGGRIWAKSKVSQGTSIFITLIPYVDEQEEVCYKVSPPKSRIMKNIKK